MVEDLPEGLRVTKACETCEKNKGPLVKIRHKSFVYLDIAGFDKVIPGFIRGMFVSDLLDESDIAILGVAK